MDLISSSLWTARDVARLQTIMSRTGSFPVLAAFQHLKAHAVRGALICDPFCGKGTTLLAARSLEMNCLGLDIAPEAVICSRAKLAQITRDDVLRYISTLPTVGAADSRVPFDVLALVHPQNARHLISLRKRLLEDVGSESEPGCATVTLAALLGILHGHASFSLSIPSAHAFAMAPSYVRRYAKDKRLVRPKRDVVRCLKEKVERCVPLQPGPAVRGTVLQGSARRVLEFFPDYVSKVDLILTSPPYLQAQTYYKDNWLRHWLLGVADTLDPSEYLQTGSVERYSSIMTEVFRQSFQLLKPGGKLICIAGDVTIRGSRHQHCSPLSINTAAILRDISGQHGFTILDEGIETVPSTRRYLNALRRTNGHNGHDRRERYFIAVKPE